MLPDFVFIALLNESTLISQGMQTVAEANENVFKTRSTEATRSRSTFAVLISIGNIQLSGSEQSCPLVDAHVDTAVWTKVAVKINKNQFPGRRSLASPENRAYSPLFSQKMEMKTRADLKPT
jgi:hypothetical protein